MASLKSFLDTYFAYSGTGGGGGGGGATNLDGLTDVVITSAATNQTLRYNGSNWVNASPNTITGSLIPDTNVTYDLGSANYRFRDLYLSGTTLNIGNASISANGNAVALPSGSTIGGASVQPVNGIFFENSLTISSNYTISSSKSAISAGPITINSGVTVTIPNGSKWVVL